MRKVSAPFNLHPELGGAGYGVGKEGSAGGCARGEGCPTQLPGRYGGSEKPPVERGQLIASCRGCVNAGEITLCSFFVSPPSSPRLFPSPPLPLSSIKLKQSNFGTGGLILALLRAQVVDPQIQTSSAQPEPRPHIPSFPLPRPPHSCSPAMYSTHRPPNDPDSFLFDLDEHYEQPTVFDNNIFADWLSEDPVTHATSQAQSISIPSHSPIVPPSSSVALASSLAFPQPTPLSTSPFTYNPLRQEFFDTQYSRSSDDVSSYDNQFLSAYSHNLPAPVWAANLWDNQTDGSIIHGEQFSFQPPATGAFDPSFVLSRESSPNDVLDAPPSPSSATRAQPYPVGRQGVQADHTAFLPSAPPTIIPLSEPYYRSPTPSRSYSRRAQSVTSDESARDRDATIRRLSKRSQQSRGEFRSTPDKFSSETPSCMSRFICPIYTRNTDPPLSTTEVYVQATQAGPFRLAALLYRLDSEVSCQEHQEAQCRTGCEGGWTGLRKPQCR